MLYTQAGDIAAVEIPQFKTKAVIQTWGCGGSGSSSMGGGGGGHVREVVDLTPYLATYTHMYYEVAVGGEAGNAGGLTRVGINGLGDLIMSPSGEGGNQGGTGGDGWSLSGNATIHTGGAGAANGGGGGVANALVNGHDASGTSGGVPCGGDFNESGGSPGGGGGAGVMDGGHGQCSIEFQD